MRARSGRAGLVVSGGGSDWSSLGLPQAPNPKGAHQSHTGLGEGPESPHALATSEWELMSSEKCGFGPTTLLEGRQVGQVGTALLHREPYFQAGEQVAQGVCAKPQIRAKGPSTEGSVLRGRSPPRQISVVRGSQQRAAAAVGYPRESAAEQGSI